MTQQLDVEVKLLVINVTVSNIWNNILIMFDMVTSMKCQNMHNEFTGAVKQNWFIVVILCKELL